MNQGMYDGLLGELRNISRLLEALADTLAGDGPKARSEGIGDIGINRNSIPMSPIKPAKAATKPAKTKSKSTSRGVKVA